MLFSSLTFLFIFLPTVLGLALVLPKNWKNGLLIFMSLLFYVWGGPTDSLILIGSILINHFLATRIQSSSQVIKRNWLRGGLTLNVLILVIFKYLDFLIENLNSLFSLCGILVEIPTYSLRLPLGISFFTFQQMSMLWDIYKSNKKDNLKLSETALYVSFFPQLIAGPIVRYHDIIDQIKNRTMSLELFRSGVQRFIIGLFRKVIIANTCGYLADQIMDQPAADLTTSLAWLGIVAYALQIYFDFSGYSDMAIGIGRMLGFRILENFNFPYISRSIQEFWRRWHISLSSWFKDYVYIPLGGNRNGKARTYLNLIGVFLLTGMWHGATWSFVFWGVFHGSFLIVERVGLNKLLARLPRPISWGYTVVVVLVGWVFFRIEDFELAVDYLSLMFVYTDSAQLSVYHYLNNENASILTLGLLFSSQLPVKTAEFIQKLFRTKSAFFSIIFEIGHSLLLIALFLSCIIYQNAESYNPFIYFRF